MSSQYLLLDLFDMDNRYNAIITSPCRLFPLIIDFCRKFPPGQLPRLTSIILAANTHEIGP
jgi:hypothetical protein